ncbi:hypothetical protein ACVXHB_23085 [Escherichia coli]
MWVAAFIGMATSFADVPSHSFIKNVTPMGSSWRTGMVYGARAGDALDGRSVRRLFAHRLRHNFQRNSGERRCASPEFLLIFPRW